MSIYPLPLLPVFLSGTLLACLACLPVSLPSCLFNCLSDCLSFYILYNCLSVYPSLVCLLTFSCLPVCLVFTRLSTCRLFNHLCLPVCLFSRLSLLTSLPASMSVSVYLSLPVRLFIPLCLLVGANPSLLLSTLFTRLPACLTIYLSFYYLLSVYAFLCVLYRFSACLSAYLSLGLAVSSPLSLVSCLFTLLSSLKFK
jgi:hypothetical protein